MNYFSLMLFLFPLVCFAKDNTEQLNNWMSLSESYAKQEKYIDAYYYLEESLKSENSVIQNKAKKIKNKYPKIISDYSEESINLCLSYGKDKCYQIMNERLQLYKLTTKKENYDATVSLFESNFQTISNKKEEENKLKEEEKIKLKNKENEEDIVISPQDKLFDNALGFGFKNYILGKTEKSLAGGDQRWFWDCIENDKKYFSDRLCFSRENNTETIAGIVPKSIFLMFKKNQLIEIVIKAKSSDYEIISEALQKKYGKGEFSSAIVSNNFGAKFESKGFTWRFADFTLSIKDKVNQVNETLIMYVHNGSLKNINNNINDL